MTLKEVQSAETSLQPEHTRQWSVRGAAWVREVLRVKQRHGGGQTCACTTMLLILLQSVCKKNLGICAQPAPPCGRDMHPSGTQQGAYLLHTPTLMLSLAAWGQGKHDEGWWVGPEAAVCSQLAVDVEECASGWQRLLQQLSQLPGQRLAA